MPTRATSPDTDFTRDAFGRYLCNGLDEALDSTPTPLTAGKQPDPNARHFDIVVLGGGTFGSLIADHLFALDVTHSHRILVLEAGPFVLDEHVQNLPVLGLGPPPAATSDPGPRNEVWGLPWNSNVVKGFPGLAYCIGGRSLFWGGWSPQLLDAEMAQWPANVVNDLDNPAPPDRPKSYFRQASEQIGVTVTNDFIFGPLHEALRQLLFAGITRNPTAVTDAIPLGQLPPHLDGVPAGQDDLFKLEAPLAVQGRPPHAGFFPLNKFSAVPLLMQSVRTAQSEAEQVTRGSSLDVNKRLMVVPRCHIIRLNTAPLAGGLLHVTEVVTDKGIVPIPPNGVVILGLGTIESTRLALNSFQGIPNAQRIGRNLIAHLRSNLTIRIPRTVLENSPNLPQPLRTQLQNASDLLASALFVKGRHNVGGINRHFHLQITASGLGALGTDAEAELFKKVPDIDFFDPFRATTESHVVITIRGIGEMEPDESNNPTKKVTRDLNPSQVDFGERKAFVEMAPSANDLLLWNAMDQASDEVARLFAGNNDYEVLVPPQSFPQEIRVVPAGHLAQEVFPFLDPSRRDGLGTTYHEAGTLAMGNNPNASVCNPDACFHFVDNTYVADPSVFPSLGSPNPMLTGIALTRRTADGLLARLPHRVVPALEPGFEYLFDGTVGTFNRWRAVGPNAYALIDGEIITAGNSDFAILFYALETFGNFILRMRFRLTDPLVDNSGVFVRFRNPLLPPTAATLNRMTQASIREKQIRPDLQSDLELFQVPNRAWSAVHSGFEVQIDEQARGDQRIGERDGLDKNRTGAIYKIPTGQDGEPRLQDFQPGLRLQQNQDNDLEIEVRADAQNPQDDVYTVHINGIPTTTFVNADASRGVSPVRDQNSDSGYIGLQSYSGSRVAFRDIRIRRL